MALGVIPILDEDLEYEAIGSQEPLASIQVMHHVSRCEHVHSAMLHVQPLLRSRLV